MPVRKATKKTPKREGTVVNIGGADRKIDAASAKIVLDIISAPHCDEATKQMALGVLKAKDEVNATISNCVIN